MNSFIYLLMFVFCGAGLAQSHAPQGTLSPKLTLVSRIYDGMLTEYWTYATAGYDGKTPAALMVFQDGGGYLPREGDHAALSAIDELVAAKKIPMMVAVFVNPGDISGSRGRPTYTAVEAYGKKWDRSLEDSMRSTEYDTVSDRYVRFLRDELLPEVAKNHTLRTDAYSRAITGLSPGGICAFNAAWQAPDQFSRIITWIGSFTAIQWHEDPAVADGGQDYPEKILRENHRNLRVWIEDGSGDQENPRYGSWPLGNIRMANALKLRDFDFHFSFRTGPHSAKEGGAEFAEEMTWLWRGYDPAKTEVKYVQEDSEKTKPPFRVSITNR